MAGLNEDVTLTVNEEPKVEKVKKKEESLSSFLPIMKCVAAALFCTFVLGCAVFSKISLISVAEQLEKDPKDPKNNERVVIMLILILMVPQAVSFVCSAWKSLRYKNNPWPTRGAVLLGITCSILEVCGLCIFTMISLSSDVNITGNVSIAVMNCVCMIPLFWQILKMCRNPDRFSTTSKIWKLVFGICGLLELGGLIFAIWIANMKDSRSYSVLSLLLISVAWSPQIRKWQIKPRLASGEEADEEHPIHPGQFLHKKTARTKATMISEGVKLLLTPFIGVLVSWNFGHIHPKDLHSGFEKLGQERDDIFTYFLVNIFVSLGGYVCSLIACSMAMQKIGFALPLTLTTPVSFVLATVPSLYNYFGINTDSDPKKVVPLMALVWLGQFLSTTYYVWRSQDFIMAKERQLFWVQSYNGVLLEQNLLLNRKNELTDDYFVNQHQMAKDSCVFICTTMYHEADYEMEQLLYSLHRVDSARAASNRRIESHIWFDGAVKREVLNNYVLQLISLVSKTMDVRLNHCMKLETPYGMELRWRLPGGMNFHIHLKDNIKVKNKKRWSQVMYMSYVLDYKTKQMGVREEDTYILTTDADIMFNAHSVEALLDLMMRDPKVGAVCGRTHPLGSGPLVWYQTFDYAIGHWFQKVANHVLGSVLCCPGCFSVYRAKALRDVLPLYASTADHAVDFLTKDMGEDRWLCTLMVQAGWRLEYCAAAENRTFCPDNFDEFYKQRRRWIPSTLANLALLISEWRMTVSNNDTVSFLFILYQAANVFSTLISPATVILIIVGGLKYAWSFNYIFSLLLLLFLTFFFCLICLFTSQDVQLKTAKVLTLIFSLLMGAVAVGVAEQIATGNARDGNPTPTTTPQKPTITPKPTTKTTKKAFYDERVIPSELSLGGSNTLGKSYTSTNASYDKKDPLGGFDVSAWYLFGLIGIFMVTALCHPTEAYCLLHGIWYLLCLPSGYIFLILYSICNLTDRSWGTRENKEKSGSDESLLKVMSDRLLWLCRGCKDPEPSHEPAAAPINSDEGSSVSESSSSIESDSSSVLEVEQKSDPKEHETEQDKPPQSGQEVALDGGPTSPNRTTTMPKSALKKGGRTRPSSPGTPDDNQRRRFRFPGERTVRFPAKLPTAKTHTPVGEWLEGKMKQYKPNFEENGYDDTSFIASMKEQDLENIGINIRGHRKKILHEIEQIPIVEIDNNVPDRVDKWLADIGLHEYWLNFKNNSYTTPRDLEDLKVMNKADLEKIVREDLGIQKQGHVNKLARAIKRLQYPSAIERKIREARQVMNGVTLRRLKYDNGDDGIEFEFWSQLREARLLPESKAFGQQSDLSQKLSELRDSSVLFLFVANLLWIILIVTLLTKTNLEVPILNVNPLGLCFLVVYGFIVVIQFLTMFWHRLSTISHLLARAPFHSGATSLKVWAFNDCDLPPPPSDEELNRIRMKRERNNQRRRQRELVESFEDEERRPLVNGGYSGSYRATGTARMSPLPI